MAGKVSPRGFLGRFLVIFVPCAALLGGLVLGIHVVNDRSERTLLEQSERLATTLAFTALDHEFDEVVADVRLLADSPELQWVLDHPRARPDRLAAEYLAVSRYRRLYDQVRFLNATGMEIVRVAFNEGQPAAAPPGELRSMGSHSYFRETFALPLGAVFVFLFEREPGARSNQPMLGFGTPVADGQGRKRGIVLLSYDGAEFFAALARATAPALGQAMLFNHEGARLRGPQSEDEWSALFPNRTFAQAFPAEWARIQAAEVGQFTTAAGLFTFTTLHPLAEVADHFGFSAGTSGLATSSAIRHPQDYQWKLVSRVTPAVMSARLGQTLRGALPLALAMLVGLAGGAAFLARLGLTRARAEAALQASERRLRDLLDTVHLLAVIFDPAGRITYVNEHLCRLTGWTAANLLGQDWAASLLPPEAGESFRAMLRAVANAGDVPRDTECLLRSREAGPRLVAWANTVLRDQDGQVVGIVSVGRDVTELRAAEEALRQAQKLEAVGRLAGGVAHDFNNILTAVLARVAELRSDATMSTASRAELSALEQDALRASTLIRQLLLFGRRQAAHMKPLEINRLLVNLLKMFHRVLGEHIRLEFSADPTELWVTGDAGMLEQVVTNLVVNARDAMPGGGRLTLRTNRITLDAEQAAGSTTARPGTFVCLTVADTGCGMDHATLPRIFEPFFTTKEASRGTGLGLASVHGIVAQHQGWITVESAVGEGSTFQIFLPLVQPAPLSDDKAPAGAVRGGRETLLLVEDEPAVRRPTAGALRRLGYQVLEAATGPEALDVWAKHGSAIAVLISDVVMPGGLTGLELATRLRAEQPALQIILASGYSEDLADSGGIPMGGLTYLAKPFPPSELARAVRACLDQGKV